MKAAAPSKPADGESLGRPLVTAEEKLYMLFREDYHARQIFEFLRVDTVGELEQYSPHQIIQILSLPLRKTVERIRQRLAENKRHLRDDSSFAHEYRTAKTPVERCGSGGRGRRLRRPRLHRGAHSGVGEDAVPSHPAA